MREDTPLRVSRRAEDTLKIHLCEDTRPGPNEEVYLHTKIHRGPNDRKGVVSDSGEDGEALSSVHFLQQTSNKRGVPVLINK